MSNILVYTKDSCPFCDQAKTLLRMKDQRFQEMKIGRDITREQFVDTFPDVRTVPFIIIDGEKVGGYDKLVEWYDRPSQQFLAE